MHCNNAVLNSELKTSHRYNVQIRVQRRQDGVNDSSSVCQCMCLNRKELNDASLGIKSQIIIRITAAA